jgi:hypothetical protein
MIKGCERGDNTRVTSYGPQPLIPCSDAEVWSAANLALLSPEKSTKAPSVSDAKNLTPDPLTGSWPVDDHEFVTEKFRSPVDRPSGVELDYDPGRTLPPRPRTKRLEN